MHRTPSVDASRPRPARRHRARHGLMLAVLLALASGSLAQARAPLPGGPIGVPLSGMAKVTAGTGHTCAMGIGGAMLCWGDNVYGQLGDGTSEERWMPVGVVGLGGSARSIAAGGSHSCAATTAGAAKCWAYNYHGQIGDGTDTDRDLPTPVSGLASGVQAVATGMIHSCALTSGGGVKCWGANGFGQLGDGSDVERRVPVSVSGLASGVQAIATGGEHTCALTGAGGVKCWGNNDYGQLGNGTIDIQYTPVDVSGLGSGVIEISAGRFHTCAVTSGGGVKCWGINEDGELGDGSFDERHTPVNVSGLASGIAEVAAGGAHTCARSSGGGVKCWGSNSWGQLGNGGFNDSALPVDVSGIASGAQAIALGSEHACAVVTGGNIKCWGSNPYGQLGDNSSSDRSTPVLVLVPDTILADGFD